MDERTVHFGEVMLELSNITDRTAELGVAGDSFNTAIYMSRLGHRVAYMTALGDDPFSSRILDLAEREHIQTDLIARLPGKVIGAYAISLDSQGERSFTYWRSTSAARSFFEANAASRILDAAENAGLLYLTGISLSLFSEDNRLSLLGRIGRMRASGRRIAFDGNYRPACWESVESARAALVAAVRLSHISLPTYEDEALLFGDASPEDTAKRHLQLGAQEVIVKCGAQGAFVSGFGWVRPERTISPVDTTGAGDSFNAAYIAARLEGVSPDAAALRGNRLAAAVLGTKGAILPSDHPYKDICSV